jgi:hypothetical protein
MSIWIAIVVTVLAAALAVFLFIGNKGSFPNVDPDRWMMFGAAIIVALVWALYGVLR